MTAIDYEAEYNNRARVPEHPRIFERWTRDAAVYRAAKTEARRAETGLKYGASARQTIDLFFPDSGAQAPLAMFIHGGYWRSLEPSQFSHMAAGLNARGVTVAVAGYDLCPQVTIAAIIDELRQACLFLWKRFGKRMMVYGHSAGGHLAAAVLATDWKPLDGAAPADLVSSGYSISGVFDLSPLARDQAEWNPVSRPDHALNQKVGARTADKFTQSAQARLLSAKPVSTFADRALTGVSMNQDLQLNEAEARRVSPLFWPPPTGRAFDSLVGALESSEFRRQARIIAEEWAKKGVATRYQEIAGANHFTVCDPLTDPNSAMVGRLAELAAL